MSTPWAKTPFHKLTFQVPWDGSHPAQPSCLLQAQHPQVFNYCSLDTVSVLFIILLTCYCVFCCSFENMPLTQGSVPIAQRLRNLFLNWLLTTHACAISVRQLCFYLLMFMSQQHDKCSSKLSSWPSALLSGLEVSSPLHPLCSSQTANSRQMFVPVICSRRQRCLGIGTVLTLPPFPAHSKGLEKTALIWVLLKGNQHSTCALISSEFRGPVLSLLHTVLFRMDDISQCACGFDF